MNKINIKKKFCKLRKKQSSTSFMKCLKTFYTYTTYIFNIVYLNRVAVLKMCWLIANYKNCTRMFALSHCSVRQHCPGRESRYEPQSYSVQSKNANKSQVIGLKNEWWIIVLICLAASTQWFIIIVTNMVTHKK